MNRSVQMGTLALGASLLAALLLTPAGTSAQTKHHLNLGLNGGTWSGEDALNIEQGIGVDASFLFSAGPSLRIGPVAEYGNFAIGDTGDRVQEVDLGVEGRFVDMSRRWGVDPYIGLRHCLPGDGWFLLPPWRRGSHGRPVHWHSGSLTGRLGGRGQDTHRQWRDQLLLVPEDRNRHGVR
jgi:hypothetical protein